MASIIRRIHIDARPDEVWDAVRDVGGLHERLVPGFVVDTRLEPGARVVTFGDGSVVRELLVGQDDDNRRLAWSATGGVGTHHNASAQVLDDGRDGTEFVWITDVLPDELADPISLRMDHGLAVIKMTMEGSASA